MMSNWVLKNVGYVPSVFLMWHMTLSGIHDVGGCKIEEALVFMLEYTVVKLSGQ